MNEGVIQKRLHISGLTPSITVTDIRTRLNSYGTVLALDGFGALNAVGQPRKFAYVTIEATEPSLARCLNVLSGTTWKGAKLRIGEAKPDYVQRLEAERQAPEIDERPSKRRKLPRGVHGAQSKDMSLVNVQNVGMHPGWHKTALLHLIRPMKMRPSRPLPDPKPNTSHKSGESKPPKWQKPKRARRDAPTRARVRIIDPRAYGPVHLRENLLESVVIHTPAVKEVTLRSPSPLHSADNGSALSDALPARDRFTTSAPHVGIDVPPVIPDFAEETRRHLALLTGMFGEDASDWGGRESVDTDNLDAADEGIDKHAENDGLSESTPLKEPLVASAPPRTEKLPSKSLKYMFKPQEEEAGFSLMPHLGAVDFDPNFDLDFTAPEPDTPAAVPPVAAPEVSTSTQSFGADSFTLDHTLPLFFPQPDNPRAKDLFSIARAEGWEFGRTGDSEAIRQRWNDTKLSLTRQWKKRSREAVKARKRRYVAVEGEDPWRTTG